MSIQASPRLAVPDRRRKCPTNLPTAECHGSREGPLGVTLRDGRDWGPVPTWLVALTYKVYEVPPASPPTVTVSTVGHPLTVTTWAIVEPAYTVTV